MTGRIQQAAVEDKMDRDACGEPIFTTTLLHLNDNCQIAILRLLPVYDLSAVAATCKQLNAIACDVYKRRSTTKQTIHFPVMRHTVDEDEFIEMFQHNVKRMLTNFGHLMNEIDFAVHPNPFTEQFNDRVFASIVEYCRGDELQKLRLRQRVELPPELIERGMRLFEHIKSFYAEDFFKTGHDAHFLSSLLSTCGRLEQLHLHHAVTATHLNQFSFPNLTEFTFTSAGSKYLSPGIEEFLLRHKSTIKKLQLTETRFFFDLSTIKEMTALNELEFCVYYPYYVQQADQSGRNQLNLNKMKIHNVDNIVAKFMTDLLPNVANSLEYFDYDNEFHGPIVECLKNIQTLISLRTHVRHNGTEILQNLSNSIHTLTHLELILSDGIIDRPFTLALSQFRNLCTLKIHSEMCVFRDDAIDSLQRFDKITHFSYTFSDTNENSDNWLRGLGSPHTMETIELVSYGKSVECYKLLNRYQNLKGLTIQASLDRAYTDILNAIGELTELEHLRIVFLRGCKWMGVRRLVERLPKLQKLQIKFEDRNFPFDLKIYNDFVNIYRLRGAKLVIEYIDHNTNRQLGIPPTILQVYGDLCRFVEIQITHDK